MYVISYLIDSGMPPIFVRLIVRWHQFNFSDYGPAEIVFWENGNKIKIVIYNFIFDRDPAWNFVSTFI